MAAYIIASIEVTDPEIYAKYTAHTVRIAGEFGGEFIVRGGRVEVLEGQGRSRNVVIRFPDFAAAQAFYASPAYQAILPHALAGSTRDLIIVDGVA